MRSSLLLRLVWLAMLFIGGSARAAPVPAELARDIPGTPRLDVDIEGTALFRESGVEGAFVLLDVRRDVLTVVDPRRAAERYVPCSTFKIPNTLIGLESGVIPGAEFALRWDGKHQDVNAWNRDQTLSTAMRDSVVWFYQEIARRVGLARMRRSVAALGYGNAQTGDRVDHFWLDGPLRISPREQVAFLRRLQAGALPVAPGHAALVRQLIVLEQHPGFTLRGKTGLGRDGGSAVGWLVGELERDGAYFVYATVVLDSAGNLDRIALIRKALTERLLARHGAVSSP